MRLLIAVPMLLALPACQVSKDDANDTIAVEYNADVAENTAADVGNTLEDVADDIGNDIEQTADKVENQVGDVDVDVDVDRNAPANKN